MRRAQRVRGTGTLWDVSRRRRRAPPARPGACESAARTSRLARHCKKLVLPLPFWPRRPYLRKAGVAA